MVDRLLVALDVATVSEAETLAREIGPFVGGFKVGSELFCTAGPSIIEHLVGVERKVFLDLKFHDIPNTVQSAVRTVTKLGAAFVNVHASGGSRMMRAAADAASDEAAKLGIEPPKVLAVTVLTSLNETDVREELRVADVVSEHVVHLARLALSSGMDGIIASPHELRALRDSLGSDFSIVTPGVRPKGSATDDQERVMTPGEAVRAGADYLVVGRPITRAQDRVAACRAITADMESGASA